MPGKDRAEGGPPVGLDRAHHLQPDRRLRRRLQQRLWRNLYDPAVGTIRSRAIPSRSGPTYEVETAGPDGTLDVPVGRRHLGRRHGRLGAGRGRARRRSARSPTTSPSTSAPRLARRPADHARRRGLFHRAGLRPRLRPGQVTDRDRPRGDVAAVPRDDQGLPHHRRRHGRGVRGLLALRREPDRCLCQPDLLLDALGDPGRDGRPGVRPAPGGLQRHGRTRATTCPG